MSRPYDVLVIGAGVAGMTAAVTAAQCGRDVVVLEAGERAGKKLLLTGDGKGYFTREKVAADNYHADDPEFVSSVLSQFTNKQLKDWLEEIGLDLESENGRMYPVSGEAADLAGILRLQMNRYFVRVETYHKVVTIEKREDGLFEVKTVKRTYVAQKVILAAGSKAAPETGSDGSGYRLAEELGLKVKKPLPALTPLRLSAPYSNDWDGVSCSGSIRLFAADEGAEEYEEIAAAQGRLELTNSGAAGMPALEVSRFAARALDEGRTVKAEISFLPGMTEEEAFNFLMKRKERVGEYLAREYLIGVIPKKLSAVLIREAGIRHSRPIHYLKEEEVRALAKVMTKLTTDVTGHGNFRQSQTCSGGILTSEVDPQTMESKAVKGLYLAGEILDVDGMYGGYNLQWAFSSGHAAGRSAAQASGD